MDYIWSGRTLSSSLLLTNGVAIGIAGVTGTTLQSGSAFISEGSPINYNRLTRAISVQELPWAGMPTGSTMSLLNVTSTPDDLPDVRLRFTDVALLAGSQSYIFENGGLNLVGNLVFKDCQIRGGYLALALSTYGEQMTLALTNNLLQRVNFSFTQTTKPFPIYLWNNLFLGGTLALQAGSQTSPALPWAAHDNLFDTVALSANVFPNSYNGYINTTVLPSSGGNNQVITVRDYQSSALGTNYYPTSGTGLAKMVGKGSRSASAAGLYHYTVRADQAKEGAAAQVSIGYHYIALNAQNLPADADADSLPDYFEDRNGNGLTEANETSFTNSDTDYDGISDGQERLFYGTDPLNPNDGSSIQLGYWRFNTTSLAGEGGELPLAYPGVQIIASWSGTAVNFDSGTANLKYRDVEANCWPNVNCRNGSISFWFKPSWASGTGPGTVGRLIEMGNSSVASDGWWALSVNAAGTQLLFESSINGTTTGYFSPQPTIGWAAGQWHQIALTYSPMQTKLYLDGALVATGIGIQSYPTPAARAANGFNIGSSRLGTQQSKGTIDELQTFNYPLDATTISADFQTMTTIDTDGDGLSDIHENEWGTDPLNPDSDGDGLTDGDEVNVYYTNPLDVDSDYDGRSDWEEVAQDIDPATNLATDPNDPNSLLPSRLGHWRFDNSQLLGDRAQTPRQALNLTRVPSWSGYSVKVESSNPANLKYSDVETNGHANINTRSGTVQFWFKPDWNSGTGPGHIARLIELGDPNNPSDGWWALSIDALGQNITYNTSPNAVVMPSAPISWAQGTWHLVSFSYPWVDGYGYVTICVDGQVVASEFAAWVRPDYPNQDYPTRAGRARNGFSLGSNRNGSEQANGEFEELETFNYPLSVAEVYYSYTNRFNMSAGLFTAHLPAQTNSSSVVLDLDGSPSGSFAVLINPVGNPPDFTLAQWKALNSLTLSDLTIALQAGANTIWIGFKASATDIAWRKYSVVVDTTAPTPVITNPPISNPAGTVVTMPLIQLQGYAEEPLSTVSYCLTNAVGTHTNEPGVILRKTFDPSTAQYTRTTFQCFDIDLAPGANHVFLKIVDLAGNATITEVIYVLDYTGVTHGPAIVSQWPTDGANLSGDTFTIRGFLDDPTATVHATVVGSGGTTESDGLVERNGLFWVENLPLNAGANQITLTATNAAGFVTTSTFTVNKSTVQIAVNSLDPSVFTNFFVNVAGTISDNNYSVWVNGAKATMPGDNTWSATAARVNQGGTATLHVRAIPNSDNGGNGTPAAPAPNGSDCLDNVSSCDPTSGGGVDADVDAEVPAFIRLREYHGGFAFPAHFTGGDTPCTYYDQTGAHPQSENVASDYQTADWVKGVGGSEDNPSGLDYCDNGTVAHCDSNLHTDWDSKGTPSGYLLACNGTMTVCGTAGGSASCPPPPEPWVRGGINWSWDYLDYHCDASVHGNTTIELHTGGKSLSHQRNLFAIYGSAYEILPPLHPEDVIDPYIYQKIDPTQIQIFGQQLGFDTRLYRACPKRGK